VKEANNTNYSCWLDGLACTHTTQLSNQIWLTSDWCIHIMSKKATVTLQLDNSGGTFYLFWSLCAKVTYVKSTYNVGCINHCHDVRCCIL